MKKLLLIVLSLGIVIGRSGVCVADQDILDTSFSFDAKKIAYTVANFTVSGEATKVYDVKSVEIWTCNRDGSNARRVTSGHIDKTPRWSPDGKQIVFTRKEDVWLVNVDGSGLKQLNKTPLHIEEFPEFSNDGKNLFYVRTEYSNVAREGEKENFLPGDNQVMAYSLVSNQERERFKSEDEYEQIVPNRADANEVFLFYTLYDPEIKTEFGKGMLSDILVVEAAKLDGTGRRTIKREPWKITETDPNISRIRLEKIYATAAGVAIQMETWNLEERKKTKIQIPTQNGAKTIENPLVNFNDISLDGKSLLGKGVRSEDVAGEWITELTLKIVNVATEEAVALDLSTLLGKKPAVVTPKPTTKTTLLPPMAALQHFAKAEAAFSETAYGEAIEEYSEAIKLFPKYAQAHYGRGRSYAKRNEWADALKDFDDAIRLNPNDMDFYLERAMTHFMIGDDNLALADYNTAIRIAPKSAKAYNERSMFYMALGQKEKGLADEAKVKELEK